MKFNLKKPLIISGDKETEEIKEIEISDDKLTAEIILEAEQKFLRDGGIYPVDEIQGSRKYLAYVLSEATNISYKDLSKLNMTDFVNITDYIKGFFGDSGYQKILELLSVK